MKFGQVDIPENLVKSLQENRVIVFAGAGISMSEPANLPNFEVLTRKILNLEPNEKVEYPDQKLGEGFDRGVKIHEQCIRILQQGSPQPTQLHQDILKLFPQIPRIITTNFDLLFEQAFQINQPNDTIKTFTAPVFPLGNDIQGIIYLHGNINDPRSMVLSDTDFGRAYLSESWAIRLLIDAFLNYDFIFIGYSYNDTILKYLTRSLPKNRASKLYAFANIEEENTQQINHWNSLGVEPLIYQKENGSHHQLSESINNLAQLLQYNFLNQELFLKNKIQEFEQNNSYDALNYVKFFLTTDDYKDFYNVARPDTWLTKTKDDQALFDVLMKHEDELFSWLTQYVETNTSQLMDLMQKYSVLKNNQKLLSQIFKTLGNTQNKICYIKWFLFLEKELYSHNNLHNGIHSWVLKKLIEFDSTQEFNRALQAYLSISIHPKQEFNFAKYELEEMVESIKLKSQISLITLNILFDKLEEYFEYQKFFSKVNNFYGFSKQEIWEKSGHGKELSFYLIDNIIVLFSEATLEKEFKNQFSQKCLNTQNVLLKRLGIYLLSQFSTYDADFIFYSLIDLKIDLLDLKFRAEFFKFLELRYQRLPTPRKIEIISRINNHFDDDREKIKWFAWIYRYSSSCQIVKPYYVTLNAKFNNYKLSSKPYLAMRSSGVYSVVHKSPFTVKEIENRTDYIWYLELLEYDFYRPSFNNGNELGYVGLWHEIITAQSLWLLDFLDFTLQVTPEHPIITKIINVAKNWKFDLETHEKFYRICQQVLKLNDKNQNYSVAQFLEDISIIEYYKVDLQQHAVWIEIAKQLTNLSLNIKSNDSFSECRFTESLNSVQGKLTSFVIKLYEQAKDHQQTKQECEDFIKVLIKHDINGYAIIRLFEYYSFIKHRNTLFAKKYLLPLMFSMNKTIKLQAWRGFLENLHLEYAEFKEIHKEFFNVLNEVLTQNDIEMIKSLTDLYVYSIHFDYHDNAIEPLRKLERFENPIITEQILDSVRRIICKETEINKVWFWFEEYLQDRIYQVNQILTENEISEIWYLLTDHPDLISKIKKILIALPFKDEWANFLHGLARNYSYIVDKYPSEWCEIVAIYLNQQNARIAILCYDEELKLFKKLLIFDDQNLLKKSLSRKGIIVP